MLLWRNQPYGTGHFLRFWYQLVRVLLKECLIDRTAGVY